MSTHFIVVRYVAVQCPALKVIITMTTETKTLQLDQIRIDGGTQPRVATDEDVVAEYADLYSEGVDLPPVTVFHDGSTYWLADGFHRYWASKRAEREAIAADIQHGTRRDAILYSVGANATHGLRRTNEDKRKAIQTLLDDEEWGQWSNREIARQCGVCNTTIQRYRASLAQYASKYSESEQQKRTYKTKHGTIAQMKTGNIGRASKSKTPHFGKNAYRPKACHSENAPVPMRAISLPLKNPTQAARSMISIYGQDYMRQVASELNRIFRSQKGLSNDCTALRSVTSEQFMLSEEVIG
jgi:hypothetical protein